MKSSLLVILLSLVKITAFPNMELLVWVFLAIGADFVSGIAKAYMKGDPRTSTGFRKSIVKFMQYGGSIVVSVILTNTATNKEMEGAATMLNFFSDGLLVFIIYVEATSIFENLYAMDQKSTFSKYIIKPVLSLLTMQLKNNPIFKAAEQAQTKPDAGTNETVG